MYPNPPVPPYHYKTYHFESVKKKFSPKRLRAKSKFPKLIARSPNRRCLDISNSVSNRSSKGDKKVFGKNYFYESYG